MGALRPPPGGDPAVPATPHPRAALAPSTPESLAEGLAERGWAVGIGLLPAEALELLAREARDLWHRGAFRRARIGSGEGLQIRDEIRGDSILWLDPSALTPAQAAWWQVLEDLRLAVNRTLYLGLFEVEGHLAVYPPGAFYAPHLDQHRGQPLRTVSVILYLDPTWQPEDGGALRLHLPGGVQQDILPVGGAVAAFLSEEILHEVLPARRERPSLTAWLRRRA